MGILKGFFMGIRDLFYWIQTLTAIICNPWDMQELNPGRDWLPESFIYWINNETMV